MKKEESAKLKFGDLLNMKIEERRSYQWDEENMEFYESALI